MQRHSVDCNRFGMGQIWYWLWREAALHWSQHWWGLWDTPFKQHTHIHTASGWPRAVITYIAIIIQRERERERDKIRQKKWGRVHETVDSESLWMPVVSDRGMMVLGKHHGAFLCVLMAWAGAHTVLCVSPPLLLCSLPFIPLFPANGCVFWTPLFCRRPLLHFIKPPGF